MDLKRELGIRKNVALLVKQDGQKIQKLKNLAVVKQEQFLWMGMMVHFVAQMVQLLMIGRKVASD